MRKQMMLVLSVEEMVETIALHHAEKLASSVSDTASLIASGGIREIPSLNTMTLSEELELFSQEKYVKGFVREDDVQVIAVEITPKKLHVVYFANEDQKVDEDHPLSKDTSDSREHHVRVSQRGNKSYCIAKEVSGVELWLMANGNGMWVNDIPATYQWVTADKSSTYATLADAKRYWEGYLFSLNSALENDPTSPHEHKVYFQKVGTDYKIVKYSDGTEEWLSSSGGEYFWLTHPRYAMFCNTVEDIKGAWCCYLKHVKSPGGKLLSKLLSDPSNKSVHTVTVGEIQGKIIIYMMNGELSYMGKNMTWVKNFDEAMDHHLLEQANKWWSNYIRIKSGELKEIGTDGDFKVYILKLSSPAEANCIVKIRDAAMWFIAGGANNSRWSDESSEASLSSCEETIISAYHQAVGRTPSALLIATNPDVILTQQANLSGFGIKTGRRRAALWLDQNGQWSKVAQFIFKTEKEARDFWEKNKPDHSVEIGFDPIDRDAKIYVTIKDSGSWVIAKHPAFAKVPQQKSGYLSHYGDWQGVDKAVESDTMGLAIAEWRKYFCGRLCRWQIGTDQTLNVMMRADKDGFAVVRGEEYLYRHVTFGLCWIAAPCHIAKTEKKAMEIYEEYKQLAK